MLHNTAPTPKRKYEFQSYCWFLSSQVIEGYRLEKPEHCHRELYNIMYYCWEAEPKERPDFADIVARLEPLINKDMDYIQLERFPDHSYYNLQHLDGEKL